MKKILLIGVLGLSLCACTQAQPTVANDLAAYGMTNIQTTGYDFFACATQEDQFSTRFTATNAQGKQVTGVLCAGFLKASTIRGLHIIQ